MNEVLILSQGVSVTQVIDRLASICGNSTLVFDILIKLEA